MHAQAQGAPMPASACCQWLAVVPPSPSAHTWGEGVHHGSRCVPQWVTVPATYQARIGGGGVSTHAARHLRHGIMATWVAGAAPRIAPFKIVGIGKNYAKHKVEMGGSAERLEEPLLFLKPPSSLTVGDVVVKPDRVKEMHHEVELGVVWKQRGKFVPRSSWRDYVAGYVLAIDVTARDLQAKAKAAGHPWVLGKGFDTFCPVSTFIPGDAIADPHDLTLSLWVDGKLRQQGHTGDMLHRIPELVEYVSTIMTMEAGDLILTGTPEGVGPMEPGQKVTATLSSKGVDLASLAMRVVAEKVPELV